MFVAAFAVSAALFSQADGEAKHAATVERLQAAGRNVVASIMCQMGGYQVERAGQDAYVEQEISHAQADGMSEDEAASYLNMGISTPAAPDIGAMTRMIQRRRAGERSQAELEGFVDKVVARCDLLNSHTDTRGMFSAAPPNSQVARENALQTFRP